MKDLKELKERIENIEVTYDYEQVYCDLINATIDYENDTQDWIFEDLFQDFVDYEIAEQYAKQELDNGGLIRLYYFLGNANLNNDLFRIDAYGNLEDVDIDDLQCLKDDILQVIEDNLKEVD